MQRLIYLPASDLAAACGLHRYRDAKTVLARTWMQQYPDQYAAACNLLQQEPELALTADRRQQEIVQNCVDDMSAAADIEDAAVRSMHVKAIKHTARQQYEAVLLADIVQAAASQQMSIASTLAAAGSIAEVLQKLELYVAGTADEQRQVAALQQQVKLLQTSAKLLNDSIESSVNTTRGKRDENEAVQAYAMQRQTTIVNGNARMYYLTVCRSDWDVGVRVGGRVDGWVQGRNIILEVKNRQRKLFKRVPLYERVQCEAYLRMTRADCLHFLERYQGNSWSVELQPDQIAT
eukprot:gene11669-11812_t